MRLGHYLLILVLLALACILTGCTTFTPGPYNLDSFQDPECYARYGGQWGYCDKIYRRDEPVQDRTPQGKTMIATQK